MLILTLWPIWTGRGAEVAVALWLWLRLRDLPNRVLEFIDMVLECIDMVVPHRFVKGYWEPSTKLAGHVVDGNFRLLNSLAVCNCFEAGLHIPRISMKPFLGFKAQSLIDRRFLKPKKGFTAFS